jgi:hypothetical protein
MLLYKTLKRSLKSLAREVLGKIFRKITSEKLINNSLTVFCYHDVSSNPSEFNHRFDLNIPPNIFEYQIEFINKNFNIISPDDLLTDNIPARAALITFDDGFRSYFKTAVPILEKYNSPSIIFLNMAPIKGEIFWSGLITYLCEKSTEFYQYLSNNTKIDLKKKPLFLYCSREIVNSYLELKGKTFKNEVDKYVGEFLTLQDLELISSNKLVFFGNHLYNHYVPLLMSDRELLKYYSKNNKELKKYPNYRDLFAFPFGQPDTCFSQKQTELLIKNGAKKVFSAYPIVNSEINSHYLHRIVLSSLNNTKSRIWFNILWRSYKL